MRKATFRGEIYGHSRTKTQVGYYIIRSTVRCKNAGVSVHGARTPNMGVVFYIDALAGGSRRWIGRLICTENGVVWEPSQIQQGTLLRNTVSERGEK